MKVKKEHGILVAVIVGLLLYIILRNPDRIQYQLPKLAQVAGREISKIEISKPDWSVILSRKDNSWYISPKGYQTDSRKIKDMLATIEQLTLTALVSESKNYSRYDLDNDKKITVKVWTGDTLRWEFEVGKAAPSHRHTFVKLAGDDRVYHARENFRGKFDQTVEDLWDRTVLSFERTEIEEIQTIKGQQSILFSRKQIPVEVSANQKPDVESPLPPKPEIIWQSADGKKGDEPTINRLLTALSNLRCEKYIENREKDDFTDPIYTVTIKGTREYTLSIFAKTDQQAKSYPAISSQSEFPFLLSNRQTENIMTDPDEMLEKPENHNRTS
jgi:hypothetical protein